VLKEEYREDLTLEEAIKLGIKSLLKSIQARGEQPKIKIAIVPTSTKQFRMLSDEEVEKYVKEVQGS